MFRTFMLLAWVCTMVSAATARADVDAAPAPPDLSGQPPAVVDDDAPADVRGERSGKQADRKARRMKRFDANGDGVLDDDEKQKARRHAKRRVPRRVLKQFDADGDGKLDENERKAAQQAARARLLKKFDADGDGKLDKSERKAAQQAARARLLKKFDADGDGKLDKSERQAAREARKARRQARDGETDAGPRKGLRLKRRRNRQGDADAAEPAVAPSPADRPI